MRIPDPVQTLELFPEEREALLALLRDLSPDEWERPTACSGWSVKDVAAHIAGGDLGNLSRRRDGFRGVQAETGEDLVTFINRFNEEWVVAARRLSPRAIIDLLAFTGPQLFAYFGSLDLSAMGGGVSWAGPGPAPVWLDVAREYTERWLHQQHIRAAVGRPGLAERRFLAPVLSTFVFALPPAFRDAGAPDGTMVQLHIEGESGGDWTVVRETGRWKLYAGAPEKADARVDVDESVAWRLMTKGLTREEAEKVTKVEGQRQLGLRALDAVAIIA